RAFGQHKGHPFVVRSNSGASEVPWLGRTERHRRYRLIERALKHANLPANRENVEEVGLIIWNWLVEKSDILQTDGNGRYRISVNRLFFSSPEEGWGRCRKCQRLYYNAEALPCPHSTCGGTVQAVADLVQVQKHNYYYKILR